jgi:hypothetical protein
MGALTAPGRPSQNSHSPSDHITVTLVNDRIGQTELMRRGHRQLAAQLGTKVGGMVRGRNGTPKLASSQAADPRDVPNRITYFIPATNDCAQEGLSLLYWLSPISVQGLRIEKARFELQVLATILSPVAAIIGVIIGGLISTRNTSRAELNARSIALREERQNA